MRPPTTKSTTPAARLEEVIRAELGVPYGLVITAATTLEDDLGTDSLDRVELVMAIEEEFGVEIPDEKIDAYRTVGDILAHLHELGVR